MVIQPSGRGWGRAELSSAMSGAAKCELVEWGQKLILSYTDSAVSFAIFYFIPNYTFCLILRHRAIVYQFCLSKLAL